jgi:futalosine hydrolase
VLTLVPTAVELRRLEDLGGFPTGATLVELCGFGVVAAAARTAELLARLRPARVLLVGIAGAYDDERHPVGSALEFDRVAIDGIGAGEGERTVGPPALGFPQWPGRPAGAPGADAAPGLRHPVLDTLELAPAPAGAAAERAGLLLTTCAASDGARHAGERRARFPEAVAEDMEGFAVALACALADVPLHVVRGVSNRVGDRDPAHWRIPAALAAARERALALLAAGPAEGART